MRSSNSTVMPELPPHSESEVLAGCRKKDRKFQELLYRKYARVMFGICLSYAKERSAAQDILQEGFIKVFKQLHNFQGSGSLEGWIRKVITNTAIDHYRSASSARKYIEYQEPERLQPPVENIYQQINLNQLLGLLKRLPEGARLIFNLYALEGYTHKEISLKLKISEGTSKSQFKRARILLQKGIAESGIERIA